MIENFLAGTSALFSDPVTILIFIFGVVGGMLFGAIPGVSMLTLAAILLPFTASLEPAQGVMLFAVIYCTGTYQYNRPQYTYISNTTYGTLQLLYSTTGSRTLPTRCSRTPCTTSTEATQRVS